MKKRHKIVFGGFTALIILSIIVINIFMYLLFIRIEQTNKQLENQISVLQRETHSKINEITENLLKISKEQEDFTTELTELKASVGEDFSALIEQSIKAVVTIKTDRSQGTGFIITEDGFIVTNSHILSETKAIEIIDYTQKTIPTVLIEIDETFDIALLKINGTFPKLELGDSEKVQIGENVIAIGNPLGLQFSVSRGIVSAKNRMGPNKIRAYIQTDAALNPGNSGGPLINTRGEIIGINNFKVSGTENIGFALESNYIKEIVNKISMEHLNQTLI